jgi:cysteine synthase A
MDRLRKLFEHLGDTPIVRLDNGLYGKLEGHNPTGSMKDRVAWYIIADAISSGKLPEGGEVVEATSGNMGISLAWVCNSAGLKFTAYMPDNLSHEKVLMMRSYGAKVVLTPHEQHMEGALNAAREAEKRGAFWVDQFHNKMNAEANYSFIAPEIFKAMPNVKAIVCGVGSGGMAAGLIKYIEEKGIDCKVIAAEPEESRTLTTGEWEEHDITGIGYNEKPTILDITKLDGVENICSGKTHMAIGTLNKLAGEKCGKSAALVYLAGKKVKESFPDGDVLCILPDNGDRYDDELFFECNKDCEFIDECKLFIPELRRKAKEREIIMKDFA